MIFEADFSFTCVPVVPLKQSRQVWGLKAALMVMTLLEQVYLALVSVKMAVYLSIVTVLPDTEKEPPRK